MNEIEVVAEKMVPDRFGILDSVDETHGSNVQFKIWIEDLRTGDIFAKRFKNEFFKKHDKTFNKIKRSKNYRILAEARFF